MKRLLLLGSLAALTTAALPASTAEAHPPRHMVRPMVAPLVSVSLQDHEGVALMSAMHGGQMFVAGEQGRRYAIRVTNNSAERVEVVLSVDGRDAVSGKMADFRTNRGYVVEPFGSVVVDGFRTSLQTVAAFRFTSPSESFAGRHDQPQNAGVIGVAVFKERRQAIAMRPMAPRAGTSASGRSGADAGAAPNATSPAPKKSADAGGMRDMSRSRQELGTGFGEERVSSVREVSFTRARAQSPDFITTLQYDSAHALADRGVPIAVQPAFAIQPTRSRDAWPGARDDRFATVPPPPRRNPRRDAP